MKSIIKQVFLYSVLFFTFIQIGYTQTPNDILGVLIENKLVTAEQADSIRAEAAIKQQEADEKKKSFYASASKNVKLAGYTQVRYQNLDEKGKVDGFDVRRVRLDIRGAINGYWDYRIQTDFVGTLKLLDAYAEYKRNDYFNLLIGQLKNPFSLENLQASNKLETIDRAQVVEALTGRGKDVIGNQNGRDIGLQVYGSVLKIKDINRIEYRFGVVNGAGINGLDLNESKDIVGRIVIKPWKDFTLGGSYYNGWDKVGSPPKSKVRNRYGFELTYKYDRFNLQSEYIKGVDGVINRDGFYGQVGYVILRDKLQTLIKYDQYNPDIKKVNDISKAYAVGLTYDINKNTRIQGFYTVRNEEKKEVNNNIGSIQFQIGF